MTLHHYGIATDNIHDTISYMKSLFPIVSESPVIYDENQDAELCLLQLEDGTKLELISGKIVDNIVKKKQYLYHVCYETDDLPNKLKAFISAGGIILSQPKEAVLWKNRKVAFIFTKLGIIELLEKEKMDGADE